MNDHKESTYLYALTADPGKPLREAKQEIQRLNDQVTILRAERDQARREVCEWVSLSYPQSAEQIAIRYGWDCYSKETK